MGVVSARDLGSFRRSLARSFAAEHTRPEWLSVERRSTKQQQQSKRGNDRHAMDGTTGLDEGWQAVEQGKSRLKSKSKYWR